MNDLSPFVEMAPVVKRLSHLSVRGYQNPYSSIQWPDRIGDDQMWMSEDLLSIWEVQDAKLLERIDRKALSKWESINFYSLNIHGIRELLNSVVSRIHSPRFDDISQFLHHFIGEENEHMWYFAEFCKKYVGRLYPERKFSSGEGVSQDVDDFMTFIRITLFEEIVDFYNVRMGSDESLPAIIQQINKMHHVDESRHIAFGRNVVRLVFQRVLKSETAEGVRSLQDYIGRYINHSLRQFYSPAAYRDAGVEDPHGLRRSILGSGAFERHGEKVMARSMKFLRENQIIADDWKVDAHA